MSILKCETLSKRYGQKEVLKSLNLTLESGKIYGLIGRNGAGKTFGIILYIVWIGSCLLLPRIINHLDELSPAQQAGVRAVTGWFTAIPPAAWFAAGIAAIAAMVTATVHLGMKQSVR